MTPASTLLADLPALVPAPGGGVAAQHGDTRRLGLEEARRLLRSGDVLVAHAAFVAGRLKTSPSAALYDVLELFAFARPAQPCIPSPLGLARALGLAIPETSEDQACILGLAGETLLRELADNDRKERLRPLASSLARAGWKWGPLVLDAVGEPEKKGGPLAGYDVWRGLPEWEDDMAPDKPGSRPVEASETRARLSQLVGLSHEHRPEQDDYAQAAGYAFGPRDAAGAPKIALIEAGTGIGKTLGYLAPASVWAEKNGPGLWLSTYTRNLQRQIVQEIARLYPDPAEREDKAVVRKGRENYLCLLNFEEAARRTALAPGQRAVALGLVARWIGATSDGDLSGQNFPAFLAASFPLSEITDRRGECIYAACSHYRTCFIESAIRRARHAPIVVANHALVIAQAASDALSLDETSDAPPERRVRYVFDEGHHLFDAADSGFSALLSGTEMADLRRWIRGPEARARSRMRGLEERLKDIVAGDDIAAAALDECILCAGALAGEGWHGRIVNAAPRGPGETFLALA
jgi:ATP-dependent DNA helicase DinG